jgi:transcriptional regulator with XRE-family HTH domain
VPGSSGSPSAAQLGAVVRRLRAARGLTLESLAGAAHIHTTYLSGIERGRRNPSWRVVGSVAAALGVEVSKLAKLAEEESETGSGAGAKGGRA